MGKRRVCWPVVVVLCFSGARLNAAQAAGVAVGPQYGQHACVRGAGRLRSLRSQLHRDLWGHYFQTGRYSGITPDAQSDDVADRSSRPIGIVSVFGFQNRCLSVRAEPPGTWSLIWIKRSGKRAPRARTCWSHHFQTRMVGTPSCNAGRCRYAVLLAHHGAPLPQRSRAFRRTHLRVTRTGRRLRKSFIRFSRRQGDFGRTARPGEEIGRPDDTLPANSKSSRASARWRCS